MIRNLQYCHCKLNCPESTGFAPHFLENSWALRSALLAQYYTHCALTAWKISREPLARTSYSALIGGVSADKILILAGLITVVEGADSPAIFPPRNGSVSAVNESPASSMRREKKSGDCLPRGLSLSGLYRGSPWLFCRWPWSIQLGTICSTCANTYNGGTIPLIALQIRQRAMERFDAARLYAGHVRRLLAAEPRILQRRSAPWELLFLVRLWVMTP